MQPHIKFMKYASENGKLGGFIHIPPHMDLALRQSLANYMSAYELRLGLECIIKESVKYLSEKFGVIPMAVVLVLILIS